VPERASTDAEALYAVTLGVADADPGRPVEDGPEAGLDPERETH